MRAWVVKGRWEGALMAEALPAVDSDRPCELVVVEVTDQGSRRPTKVARLMPIGEQRILAELVAPTLAWMRGWKMLLCGIDVQKDGKTELFQTWLVNLIPPAGAKGFRVADIYQNGVRRRGSIKDLGSTQGDLIVSTQLEPQLRREVLAAELFGHSGAHHGPKRLTDCYIEWMGAERFELGGWHVRTAFEERPEQVMRNAWLCEFYIDVPELTKAQYRMMRH